MYFENLRVLSKQVNLSSSKPFNWAAFNPKAFPLSAVQAGTWAHVKCIGAHSGTINERGCHCEVSRFFTNVIPPTKEQ